MMSFILSSISSEWERLINGLSPVHSLLTTPDDDRDSITSIFLPNEYIFGTFVPAVLIVAFSLTIIYNVSFNFVHLILPKEEQVSKIDKSKAAYQITNCIFNVIVGIVGLYQYFIVIPNLQKDQDDKEFISTVIGYHYELYHISALQLGYQIFVLPICIFVISENIEMIFHHFAVVFSTGTSGLLIIGFRYYIPYFYGIFELSSIPLSIMNHIKLHPKLKTEYPNLFTLSRNIFAISFIIIRIICSPGPKFIRDCFVVMYTTPNNGSTTNTFIKLYLFIQVCFATFLQLLQIYWASLIMKGLLKVLTGSGDPVETETGKKTKKKE